MMYCTAAWSESRRLWSPLNLPNSPPLKPPLGTPHSTESNRELILILLTCRWGKAQIQQLAPRLIGASSINAPTWGSSSSVLPGDECLARFPMGPLDANLFLQPPFPRDQAPTATPGRFWPTSPPAKLQSTGSNMIAYTSVSLLSFSRNQG